MSGIPRDLAYAVAAGTNWKKAFAAIEDDSPILLAGMAEWIRVTTFEESSDRVYYMITEAACTSASKMLEAASSEAALTSTISWHATKSSTLTRTSPASSSSTRETARA
jgi:hypothetical protein